MITQGGGGGGGGGDSVFRWKNGKGALHIKSSKFS